MDRATMADTISRAVAGSRAGADQAAALLQLATRHGLLPPDHYRRHVEDASSALADLRDDLDQLLDLLTYFVLLYPEAHDDAAGENARPGDCACGRPAARCPARAAAAAGELEWKAEDGRTYPISEAGPKPGATAPLLTVKVGP